MAQHRFGGIPRNVLCRSLSRLFLISGALIPNLAAAESDSYHLLNPTPSDQLRELNTDRPDTTESPYTVDAGHFQVEMTAFGWHRDTVGSIEARELTFLETNAKVGLTTWADLQLVIETYKSVQVTAGSAEVEEGGFGDLTLRTKFNLWGNDGGRTAFALMPFVTLPTAEDGLGVDGVEGGLIVPLGIQAPAGFSVGLMVEIDAVHDDEDELAPSVLFTATTSHELTGPVSGFVEWTSLHAQDEWAHEVHAGVTIGVGDNLQLDAGGTTDTSGDSVGAFCGVSVRR